MTIRILLAEDNPDDAALIQRQLRQSGVDVAIRRVDSASLFRAALDEVDPDVILTDHSMPQFTARDALRIARDARPQTPVIVVTGSLDEETAADYIKDGAADYVLKTHLVRLPAALVGALERRRALVATEAAHKALRGSEAKFAKAFNANPSGMAITTLEGRVVDVNEAFLRTLGYTRDEAIGSTTVELGLWRSDQERAHAIQETQHFGRVQQLEIEGRTKESARRTLLYSAELIELEGVPHVLVLTTDVTERRQLEDQLRQAGKMEAVGQLAGGVAHDFNNILTAILGYADLLAEGLPAEDQRREDLDEIRKAAQRAAALTRQLLAFSRKQVLEPRALDVNVLVDNMDKMLRPILGENVELRAIPAPNLHAVRADPNQIEQVILNLAINARDAMSKGGKLTIETANVDLDEHYAARHATVVPGPHVMLAVSDTGTGMDAATQARIFEPFFTTKDPGRGTGLGLATVYGIVKQSGGSIWVYSELGRGTTFKIYLPALDAPAERIGPFVPVLDLVGTETILLVEDDEQLLHMAHRALEARGYTVLAAGRGDVALQTARGHVGPIHLLLSDVTIPDMDGRTLAATLRAQRPDVRVLYMSGYADQAIVRHGVLDAMVAYLPKPFTTEAIARRVREVLDTP
ncbi:MAG TPA: response regulator [Gemmatimonadales bacterium]|jgi:PAS domain S-box-containing protein|nr:response regulator [Gemmatimonadales bacterium]